MWVVTGSNFGGGFSRWAATSEDLSSWADVEMAGPSDGFGEVKRLLRIGTTLYFMDANGYVVTTGNMTAFTTERPSAGASNFFCIGADSGTPAPAVVFLAGNSHFWYTLDDGVTFTDTGDNETFVPYIIYMPPTLLTPNGIWFTAGVSPIFGDVAVDWHDGDPTVPNWFNATFSGGGSSTFHVGCYDTDAELGIGVGVGDVYSTLDGKAFTRIGSAPISSGEQIMVHLGGITLLGATSGRLYTSADNITWSANLLSSLSGLGTIRDISYDGTQYVAIDSNRNVLSSPDAVTWTIAYTFPAGTTYGISWFEAERGHGFFRYPLYWDQINGEVGR
jgi:hypothetical protein